ncbi:unnamed protein product, partial [Discosporangium mesarthrocarpum]
LVGRSALFRLLSFSAGMSTIPPPFCRVDKMLEDHVGKDKMVFPPYSRERLAELGELVSSDFEVYGVGWRESAVDVAISGLGWISLTGAGPVRVRVRAPRDVLVTLRDPLMPYESWDTTAKFTGASTIKRGKKKQGRRA